MGTDDRDNRDRLAAAGARVFAVRVWKEEAAAGSGYRGSVRDVMTDASRAFSDWSDLVAFMAAGLERDDRARAGRAEGGV